MDRNRSQRAVYWRTMPTYWPLSLELLLYSSAAESIRPTADETGRRDLYRASLLWFSTYSERTLEGGASDQSEAGPGDYAEIGASWHFARPPHIEKSPGAPQISLPIAGALDCQANAGMELRYHLYSITRGVCVPHCRNRLVQPLRCFSPALKQPGEHLLHRGRRRGHRTLWAARDLQHRSRGAIFCRRICAGYSGQRDSAKYGRPGKSSRQYIRREALEVSEIRGHLFARLPKRPRSQSRCGRILSILQHQEIAPIARIQDAT